MSNIKAILFTWVLCFAGASYLMGQNIQNVGLINFSSLQYVDRLPKYLCKSKSVVFVSMPDKPGPLASTRGDWKAFSEQAHEGFKRSKIDAVAYYYLDDVYAGASAMASFEELFQKRGIKYLILLEQSFKGPIKQFSITVTGFTEKNGLNVKGQKAWRSKGDDFPGMLNSLYLLSNSSGLEVSNLLINDLPEYFGPSKIKIGQRYEAFQPNLKTDKLAVLEFEPMAMPDGLNDSAKQVINNYNLSIKKANEQLAIIMESYPYQYSLMPANSTHKELRDKGYQFVLKYANTIGLNIKQLLAYKTKKSETHYISIVWHEGESSFKKYPLDTHVYKYYMMNTVTNNLYLGTKWDADVIWDSALTNHINNLKEELKVN